MTISSNRTLFNHALTRLSRKDGVADFRFHEDANGSCLATFTFGNRPYRIETCGLLNGSLVVMRNDSVRQRFIDGLRAFFNLPSANLHRMDKSASNSDLFTKQLNGHLEQMRAEDAETANALYWAQLKEQAEALRRGRADA